MSLPLLTVSIKEERDVVLARQRARQVAGLLGFDAQDQTRIATAVSEVARNAFSYAGGGRAEMALEGKTAPQVLVIRIFDSGPGISDVEHVLSGQYQSRTGMGLGLIGSRRLMDGFTIESTGAGTTVQLKKILPRHAPYIAAQDGARLSGELARQRPAGALQELQQQNQELLAALQELQRRQAELERLNGELEDTNRGVVALYAELDEKADHLRRADSLKTRFLSEMSHEFRTPLNSIIGISRILLAGIDGPLAPEQTTQVGLVEGSACELLSLVNDLLDLAKVEAGKIDVRPGPFRVGDLFGALRGMLRPLLASERVRLTFESADDLPTLVSDEGKVSQILRNFISNALKFTEHGEVRVWATLDHGDGQSRVTFYVKDTGIGIAPEHLEPIFEDFSQIDSPVQRRVKGTGLGLPLTRRLAGLLGGAVGVESEAGVGSTFRLTVPLVYEEQGKPSEPQPLLTSLDPDRSPILVVEDNLVDQMLFEKFLKRTQFQPVNVRTVLEARRALREWRPAAILLDVVLGNEDTWGLLAEVKHDPQLSDIPVLMITTVDDEDKAMMLGADAFTRKPIDRSWLLDQLGARVPDGGAG